jgi:hypothetical protein
MAFIPDTMNIDFTSLLAGISITALAGWLGSFFALRKDERSVQIEQVTKERTKWRDNIRKLTEEIVVIYITQNEKKTPDKVASCRCKLATALNPKDDHDNEILSHFDDLFAGKANNIDLFTRRIALLLKHDWERVKWDCTPIYIKPFIRCCSKQNEWRSNDYRKVEDNPAVKRATPYFYVRPSGR